MLKRKYFLSVKVAHNDNTGQYSWWNTTFITKGWKEDVEQLLTECRETAADVLSNLLEREIDEKDIEVIAFNRV